MRRLPQQQNKVMSGLIVRILIGSAVALAAHAQPKPPPDKAPSNETKPPEAKTVEGQNFDNAIALCIGCHGIPGYKTAFPAVYHVPKIEIGRASCRERV